MPVTVKTSSQVSSAIKKMMTRAEAAVKQRNWDYAFQILREILLAEPGFNEARLMLREAQLDKIGRQASAARQLLATVTTAWAINVSGPMKIKKGDLANALDIGEKAMEADPTVLGTLKYICKAAEAAGLSDIAINALETATDYHPKNVPTLKQLASLYEQCKMGGKAVSIWQKIVALQPSNPEAQNKLKHATALAAMEQAEWEKEGDFRGKLKDAEEQDLLEIAKRGGVRDAETRVRVIQALVEELEKDPKNITNFRRLADLYHQNEDFDEAIDCYKRITELTQTKDPAIDSAITTVLQDKFNRQIQDLKDQLADHPENAEALQSALTDLEARRDESLLVRFAQRVEHYPNEPQFRLELGEVLLRADKLDEALEQFQHAQRSTHHASRAHQLMGTCFARKGIQDLAIEQFQQALSHRDRMRAGDLKAVLYDLSLAQETKGDKENALATLKELYGIDVSYKDVAQRIEKHYNA
ncbi:MAG: hypothetical protein RRC34_00655 [Lentisphaeria bacterium]|nr:hypothetical protein [Lentisphaeria bacterium]